MQNLTFSVNFSITETDVTQKKNDKNFQFRDQEVTHSTEFNLYYMTP